ncbi:hypothetical protein ACVWZK_003939 [Bradyrhizobium sp. GM0.4]
MPERERDEIHQPGAAFAGRYDFGETPAAIKTAEDWPDVAQCHDTCAGRACDGEIHRQVRDGSTTVRRGGRRPSGATSRAGGAWEGAGRRNLPASRSRHVDVAAF